MQFHRVSTDCCQSRIWELSLLKVYTLRRLFNYWRNEVLLYLTGKSITKPEMLPTHGAERLWSNTDWFTLLLIYSSNLTYFNYLRVTKFLFWLNKLLVLQFFCLGKEAESTLDDFGVWTLNLQLVKDSSGREWIFSEGRTLLDCQSVLAPLHACDWHLQSDSSNLKK